MAIDTSVAHLCPPWAYDPHNRERPRNGNPLQPKWAPILGRRPMPNFEQLVASILTQHQIQWVYEPLVVRIDRPVRLPDPHLKHRRPYRHMCNDFYLPKYQCVIEIYSGCSRRSYQAKLRHLQRMRSQHGIGFLLLGINEWKILERQPARLPYWVENLPAPHQAAA